MPGERKQFLSESCLFQLPSLPSCSVFFSGSKPAGGAAEGMGVFPDYLGSVRLVLCWFFSLNFPEFWVALNNLVLWLRLVLRVWSESKTVVPRMKELGHSSRKRRVFGKIGLFFVGRF